MAYSKKIVLHTPNGLPSQLDALVEQLIKDGVILIAAVGQACAEVEEAIDWIDVMNSIKQNSAEYRFILTSSHPGESLSEVIAFAESLTGDFAGEVQVVEI